MIDVVCTLVVFGVMSLSQPSGAGGARDEDQEQLQVLKSIKRLKTSQVTYTLLSGRNGADLDIKMIQPRGAMVTRREESYLP